MTRSSIELKKHSQDMPRNSSTNKSEANTSEYYQIIANYYDADAADFERRYNQNPVLQKIRSDFRQITEQYPFESTLEIGIGPGIDIIYFASKYPHKMFYGIDVSPEMVNLAKRTIEAANVENVMVNVGTPEILSKLYPNKKFDLIYTYFGALNTVPDLRKVVNHLHAVISENGTLILTFVNRWYLVDILWNLFRLNPSRAFARITDKWRGYSTDHYLPSTCRSAREINSYFSPNFKILWKKGYSILYPAWYRAKYLSVDGLVGNTLWFVDQLLNKTPLWNLGEYTLYVIKPC